MGIMCVKLVLVLVTLVQDLDVALLDMSMVFDAVGHGVLLTKQSNLE